MPRRYDEEPEVWERKTSNSAKSYEEMVDELDLFERDLEPWEISYIQGAEGWNE